jgi:hypothetical protein
MSSEKFRAIKINLALAEVGAIEIVRPGDNRKGGKATEFRCLLPQTTDESSQNENAGSSESSLAGDVPF